MSGEMHELVPFNRARFGARAELLLQEALASGKVSGDGPFTRRCRDWLEREIAGTHRALLTTSCTHALEMSALLLNVGPGDEVILPSFTFVSTANAFALRGAKVVFADVRPDTLNIDEAQLPALITPATRLIVPVHYAGIACEMDTIMALAEAHELAVVEDNAHGFLGGYKGQALGTIGALSTLSFHETKNFSCGEGGALLVNDPALAQRAEIIREKGTNRARFFRGEIDKYTWVDIGSSYLMSDLLAAVLLSQLEEREAIQLRRAQIWTRYMSALERWSAAQGVQLPHVPQGCSPAYHLFYMIMPTAAARGAFMAHMRERQVHTTFHYLPLHLSEHGERLGGRPGMCPVTERVADCLVRLPLYHGLSDEALARVIEAALSFSC